MRSRYTYNGDTTLTNIAADTEITIKDGSLTVTGNIGEGAHIKFVSTKSQGQRLTGQRLPGQRLPAGLFGSGFISANTVVIHSSGTSHRITVHGNVHRNVKIECSGASKFSGYLFSGVSVKSHNGDYKQQILMTKLT